MFRITNEDREDGFTLVEILVGIVIIGILLGIAISLGINQKRKALEAKFDVTAKSITKEIADSKVRVLTSKGYKVQYTAPTMTEFQKSHDTKDSKIARYAYVNGKRVTYNEGTNYESICVLLYNSKDTYNELYRQTIVVTASHPEGTITKGKTLGCPATVVP